MHTAKAALRSASACESDDHNASMRCDVNPCSGLKGGRCARDNFSAMDENRESSATFKVDECRVRCKYMHTIEIDVSKLVTTTIRRD